MAYSRCPRWAADEMKRTSYQQDSRLFSINQNPTFGYISRTRNHRYLPRQVVSTSRAKSPAKRAHFDARAGQAMGVEEGAEKWRFPSGVSIRAERVNRFSVRTLRKTAPADI